MSLEWIQKWSDIGLLAIRDSNGDGILQVNEFFLNPDIIVLATPEMAGLPYVISGLVAAGGMAAAMSTADGLLLAMANTLSHDLYYKIIDPKAEYLVTVTWPDNNPDDIDTWIEDPNGEIVWFRSRDAGLIHLDRDDRGMLNDTLDINGNIVKNPLNQEVVTIRGVVPGEYIVNVHYYATETEKPVPVTVKVDKVNPTLEVIYYDTLTLDKKGDEKTALRFRINQDGRVSDIGHTPKSLVVATKR